MVLGMEHVVVLEMVLVYLDMVTAAALQIVDRLVVLQELGQVELLDSGRDSSYSFGFEALQAAAGGHRSSRRLEPPVAVAAN